jgi:L-threonylcarbamoyladenylate synthase
MTPTVIEERDLERAVDALRSGAVIAIPTDTVYGLAVRLDQPSALDALFALKGRPRDLALPVLVGKWRQSRQVAADWPREASYLASRFWPGPLTVVVPARPEVGSFVGGDGKSVGVRLPDHRFVRRLCVAAGPLAVTSANPHGAPACTEAIEVASAFAEESPLELIVDGGTCDQPTSTVVDCTVMPPRCVREGSIPWEWILASLR